jgi:hypothetical protein
MLLIPNGTMEAKQPGVHLTAQLAKHFREVHFGVNWTWSNLKEHVSDVTWQQAITPVHSLNTIAALVYHIHYFVGVALRVLEGGPLAGSDKYSFDHPPIQSQEDWERLLSQTWSDAEKFARLVEQLPEQKLWETFGHEKYGSYYRNIQGIIEHSHYHLGQIVLVKKLLKPQDQ